jgi:phosphoribosyl-dephospho-CoA transferase
MIPIPRHRWVRIGAGARHGVVASCSAVGKRDQVAQWLALGRPLIARARQASDSPGEQPLGLCLPRASGKLRIALSAPPGVIEGCEEAASLSCVAEVLPEAALPAARELVAMSRRLGFEARAFGSAAWQWRTAEIYLGEGSDLDVLAAPPDGAALREWLALLERLDARAAMRLDGEIECPSGDSVNWRELASGAETVLLKSCAGVRLAPAATVWEQFR